MWEKKEEKSATTNHFPVGGPTPLWTVQLIHQTTRNKRNCFQHRLLSQNNKRSIDDKACFKS
eukprot:m.16793 g.16793  ORF g.16793 m.16793 type:complete len:62 (+) comp8046_c0_seq2:1846-2031(+)